VMSVELFDGCHDQELSGRTIWVRRFVVRGKRFTTNWHGQTRNHARQATC
jgi:hypothetical protein